MGEPPAVGGAAPAVWVNARQFTGRIVTVSNSMIFTEPVYNYSRDFPLLWEEMHLPITYTDDRAEAERVLLDVARRHTQDYRAQGDAAIERMLQRYSMPPATLEPRVFYRITDNWLELGLRFVAPVHGARELKDAMSRDILAGFDAAGIGIASATYDIVGFPSVRIAGAEGGTRGVVTRVRAWFVALAETFWFVPGLMVIGGIGLGEALVDLDRSGIVPKALVNSPWLYGGSATGARTLLGAVASSTIGVAGTVFSITIAALSLAAGQMGPRLLRNFTHDRGNQATLGVFLATFSFALIVLRSVRTVAEHEFVPHVALSVALLLAFVCVGTLVFFVGHMADRINVDNVIEVREQGSARVDPSRALRARDARRASRGILERRSPRDRPAPRVRSRDLGARSVPVGRGARRGDPHARAARRLRLSGRADRDREAGRRGASAPRSRARPC